MILPLHPLAVLVTIYPETAAHLSTLVSVPANTISPPFPAVELSESSNTLFPLLPIVVPVVVVDVIVSVGVAAFKCNNVAGAVVPIPTFPVVSSILNRSNQDPLKCRIAKSLELAATPTPHSRVYESFTVRNRILGSAAADVLSKYAPTVPTTCNVNPGLLVPIPTFEPLIRILSAPPVPNTKLSAPVEYVW